LIKLYITYQKQKQKLFTKTNLYTEENKNKKLNTVKTKIIPCLLTIKLGLTKTKIPLVPAIHRTY